MKLVLMLGRHPTSFVREHLAGIDPAQVRKHFIDYPRVYKKLGHRNFQVWLIEMCSRFRVDTLVVDAINGFYYFDQKTFSHLVSLDVALIGTSFDNSTEHRFYLNCYQQFHGVVVTSSRTRFSFDAYGIPTKLYWPQTMDYKRRWVLPSLDRDFDCSFVGSMKASRRVFLKKITEANVGLICFGSNTPNGRVNKDRYWEILGSSKITLNFNRQNHHSDWVALDPLSVWRSIPTLRNLEAGLAGSLCLAEWVPEFEDLFPGFDDLTFVTADDALAKIKFFLENPEIRLKRSREFQDRCLELHKNKYLFGLLLDQLSTFENKEHRDRNLLSRGEIYEEPAYRINKCIFFFRTGRNFLLRGKFGPGLESLLRCLVMIPLLHCYWLALPGVYLASSIDALVRKR